MTADPRVLLNRFMLALACWREARGESSHGKRLVCATIRNRVEDGRWPNTYSGVILQPLQFSSFNPNDPNAVKFPSETDASWASCVAAADAILDADVPPTIANHYCVRTLYPKWRDDTKLVASEGAHVFFHL